MDQDKPFLDTFKKLMLNKKYLHYKISLTQFTWWKKLIWSYRKSKIGMCEICGEESPKISDVLSLCLDCIREYPEKALNISDRVHAKTRAEVGLPESIPEDESGVRCSYCSNHCKIPKDEAGYCNLSKNVDDGLSREYGTDTKAIGSWYKDRHPTNCVASWYCAGGTGVGYPEYSKSLDGDRGYTSAALFLGTCSNHCLYCQNKNWRKIASEHRPILKTDILVNELISDDFITCLCWFGGSPEPQSPFVYEVSRRIHENTQNRIFRICLEANGNFKWPWLKKIADISMKSGGGIKFDLKTHDEDLNRVLSGVSNKATFENFKKLGEYHKKREELPFLRASTLLIPGYVDIEEIRKIANFISSVDPSIPYSLLAFHPDHLFDDMPVTSKELAEKAEKTAEKEGLKHVTIGNKHLLR